MTASDTSVTRGKTQHERLVCLSWFPSRWKVRGRKPCDTSFVAQFVRQQNGSFLCVSLRFPPDPSRLPRVILRRVRRRGFGNITARQVGQCVPVLRQLVHRLSRVISIRENSIPHILSAGACIGSMTVPAHWMITVQ